MTDHGTRRQFRRRQFSRQGVRLGRFDSLEFGEPQSGVGTDSVEWHDMREAIGLPPDNHPHETFGAMDKDGQWHEQLRTTSGKMLDWLSATTRSTATFLWSLLNRE